MTIHVQRRYLQCFLIISCLVDSWSRVRQEVLVLWRAGQSFDVVLSPGDTDDGHTRNLSNPSLEIPIVCRDDIDAIFDDSIDDTIVCIGALVITLEPLPTLISRESQCNPIFRAQLFQFCHDARRDDRAHGSIEEIHHCLERIEFVVYCQRKEICVHENGVGWLESGIVLEEER